jgi:cysteine desulfurase/selenocysteine lyase
MSAVPGPGPASPLPTLDVERLRADFPILHQQVNGSPLAYLDNAASTQRPMAVLDAMDHYYRHDHANVHRGVHTLSHRATDRYEHAREVVRGFLNAASIREIIFTRGTTEAINLVAYTLGQQLQPGDEILVSELEHHSNIVPWQLLCERTGAVLRVGPITDRGEIDLDAMLALIGPRTRLVGVAHVSNALGTVNPIAEIISAARRHGALTLVDGAQAVAHLPVDVRALDCDFYALSGHKLHGPTGIGVLYGRESVLAGLPPFQGGGDMIATVSFSGTTYNELPYRFEAGTPAIAEAIGLGAAIEYLARIGVAAIADYEEVLVDYALAQLKDLPGIRFLGNPRQRVGLVSFNLDGIHPHDVGTVLDQRGVAVRAGHHCAMPVMEHFGVAGSVRASFALYNTRAEVDRLLEALRLAVRMFAP